MNVLQSRRHRGPGSAAGRLALWMLHSPLRFVLGSALAELAYTGPRTGRLIRFPVMYAQAGDQVVVLAGGGHRKTWWRNFLRPRRLDVTIAGRLWDGTGVVAQPGTARFHAALAIYRARFHHAHYRPGDRLIVITLYP